MGGIINTGFEDKQTNEFVERFADKTIEQLISSFNEEQPKKGWVSARGRFLSALREAFLESGVDCCSFISDKSMSMNHQIRLEDNVMIQISES
ncbi:MAG: hypothetical protein OR994_08240 [Candidatus Poseidoniales archaeon]|nr:hypothetical protein [Candidatus Poseidoniales archaeon]